MVNGIDLDKITALYNTGKLPKELYTKLEEVGREINIDEEKDEDLFPRVEEEELDRED